MTDILVVFHPCCGQRPRLAEIDALRSRLLSDGHVVETLATIPGPDCVALITRHITDRAPQCVVAAGGDGTVRNVVEALLSRPQPLRPPLALLAMGTADNAARSIDPALPRSLAGREDRLARVLAGGFSREMDAGLANGRAFLGSVAVGMDAEILAWRNAARPRVPKGFRGYPLYLASCAVNALRVQGGAARLELWPTPGDAPTVVEERVVNVLVTNTALYAGEFRFAGGSRHHDGRLDVLWNRSMGDYLRRYAAAWPRHLRVVRGLPVRDDEGIVTAARIVMEWSNPVAWQLDGEQMSPASRLEITVAPAALRVLTA